MRETRARGSILYFLEEPGGDCSALQWFRDEKSVASEMPIDGGYVLHFSAFGDLQYDADGTIDPIKSPLVTVFPPRVVQGVLWTAGEVRFTMTGAEASAPYRSLLRNFTKWMKKNEIVYEVHPNGEHGFDYYLEGSLGNVAPVIYAMPSGLQALQSGRYFISHRDAGRDLSILRKMLRLRGVKWP